MESNFVILNKTFKLSANNYVKKSQNYRIYKKKNQILKKFAKLLNLLKKKKSDFKNFKKIHKFSIIFTFYVKTRNF